MKEVNAILTKAFQFNSLPGREIENSKKLVRKHSIYGSIVCLNETFPSKIIFKVDLRYATGGARAFSLLFIQTLTPT